MKILISYGEEKISLSLSESIICDNLQPAATEQSVAYDDFLKEIQTAEKGLYPVVSTTLFIINDAYRPTPNDLILKWLFQSGRLNPNAIILIATGCHPSPSGEQLKKILGSQYEEMKGQILMHDAAGLSRMAWVGQDRQGEPVYLNRAFFQNERILAISSVEPHYFAGFTGGRKSIFPGISDRATTVRNHSLAVSFDASPMKLDGNPVEEHFRSLMKLIEPRKLFGIQLVVGRLGEINAVFCGELNQAFNEAAGRSKEIYGRPVKSKYDLVIAEVYPPLDSNLYQVQKALENCQAAVKDGGAIILFAPCREGIGNEEFFKLAERWRPDGSAELDPEDTFGIHKLHRVFRIGRRINVYLYSELDKGIPEKVYFRTCKSPQDIIDELTEDSFDIIKTAVVRDAGHTVLTVN